MTWVCVAHPPPSLLVHGGLDRTQELEKVILDFEGKVEKEVEEEVKKVEKVIDTTLWKVRMEEAWSVPKRWLFGVCSPLL